MPDQEANSSPLLTVAAAWRVAAAVAQLRWQVTAAWWQRWQYGIGGAVGCGGSSVVAVAAVWRLWWQLGGGGDSLAAVAGGSSVVAVTTF